MAILTGLVARIDAEIARTQSAETGKDETAPRSHLGASMIGRKCLREVWYGYRWSWRVMFEGRVLRLFNRGHEEEPRFVRWLERVGATVETIDPESLFELWYVTDCGDDAYHCVPINADLDPAILANGFPVSTDPMHVARAAAQGVTVPDPRQHRFVGYLGHFGGSLDAIATGVPGLEPYGFGLHSKLLVEFKTHGLKSFTKLVSEGMPKAKPEHFMQSQLYAHEFQCDGVLYMAVNKNDDALHIEVHPLDPATYNEALGRARYIVDSPVPPPRMPYASPSNFDCKYCDYRLPCHFGVEWWRNCRSCVNSKPVDGGEWLCNLYGKTIPKEFIINGCGNWQQIPND